MLTYRSLHVRHHNHLYDPEDPDLPLYAPYPKPARYVAGKLLKDLFALTLLKNIRYFNGGVASRKRPDGIDAPRAIASEAAIDRARRIDRRHNLLFQVAVLAIMAAAGWLRAYLVYWALPLFTVVQVLIRFRAMADHAGVPDRSTRLLNARTMVPHPVMAFLIAPHGEHYHIEHHLWPAIPHYNLARAHRLLEARGALAGVPIPTTYREVVRAVVRSVG
jgi:fatty acid desaturase